MEIIYEYMKDITGVEPEFKWGKIYQMIKDKTIPDAGLEDILLYINIKISTITKVATCPELFLCSEVIGWILSRTDAATLVVKNTEKKVFSSFILA